VRAHEISKQIKFDLKEEVEFAIISGKDNGVIDEITLTPDGVLYGVVWSNKSHQRHYDFELKKKKQ
jgi:hypothetical protein